MKKSRIFGTIALMACCVSYGRAEAVEVETFGIENDAVAEYIANTTATLSAVVDTIYYRPFFDTMRDYRPDQPKTKTITFGNEDGAEVNVLMATDPDYANVVLNANTTGASFTLRNFVPGNTYYYKVSKGNDVLLQGALKAEGQVRMIAIDHGFNIRDLGGWTGLDGKTIRYEQLYRGGSLGGTDKDGNKSDIMDEDRAELERLGIRAQLDLRAVSDGGLYRGEFSLHSYTRGETTLNHADFINTMTDFGAYNKDASVVCDIAWIIYELKQGHPVYFNCRQGADRTGTTAFIIEGLLGCYGNDQGHQMAMDYELTGFSMANLVDNIAVRSSYRGATEAFGNPRKLFQALLNLEVPGVTLNTVQEKCYYYLNQYWKNRQEAGSSDAVVDLCIDKKDLDWFIEYMLGMKAGEYAAPSWAKDGGDLKTVAEAKANVVKYINR